MNQRAVSIVAGTARAYNVYVYFQAVLHVEAGMEYVRDLWRRDPWFSAELFRQSGREFYAGLAVEPIAGGADTTGGLWLDFGPSGRMGLLPVSDGTDIVLQLAATLPQNLWDRVFHSTRRRLRHFSEAAKVRLEEFTARCT